MSTPTDDEVRAMCERVFNLNWKPNFRIHDSPLVDFNDVRLLARWALQRLDAKPALPDRLRDAIDSITADDGKHTAGETTPTNWTPPKIARLPSELDCFGDRPDRGRSEDWDEIS